MNLQQRADLYRKAFPGHPPMNLVNDRLEAVWIIGNSYGGSKYYGSYPGNYLKRVFALFPGCQPHTLHLFSGSLPKELGYTVDLNPANNPSLIADAEKLSEQMTLKWDLILADPPYSREHAEKYGFPMIDRRKVLGECWKVISPGGWLIWLDEVCPIFSKEKWHWGMFFPIFTSTNRRIRAVFGFQKKA
jgi:hypothetical protein